MGGGSGVAWSFGRSATELEYCIVAPGSASRPVHQSLIAIIRHS